MSPVLSGFRVVVTGAGRGLGRAVAVGMAREGANLVLTDFPHGTPGLERELDQTAELARGQGAKVALYRFDLGDADACRGFVKGVFAEQGAVHGLVNNAGVLFRTPVNRIDDSQWETTLNVNLRAPMLLSQGFLPPMIERGGSIINLSSRAGAQGFELQASYCASKFGVEGLTRAMAAELLGHAISVNTVTPGIRIKPTMMTMQQESQLDAGELQWEDGRSIVPAFIYLARARGRPSGLRYDAERLAKAVLDHGYGLGVQQAEELSE